MINYNDIFNAEGLSYLAYRNLIDELLAAKKTTGSDHSDAMLHYTKMNVQRMNRVDKTVQLSEELFSGLNAIEGNYRFLVISEGWCGDAAQIVPVFDKMATAFPDKFDLKFVLRDTNLPLIDAHLTNGGRAIPVLLVLDNDGKVITKWGPRPQMLQDLLAEWKSQESDMMALAEKLHAWYAKDKTKTTQQELAALFSSLQ
ncbi:MAG: thioredoxin family protein [Candidatus Pedobacter colombiensis]|uniref:Thioredoxin family protein n=1 Tax=Candidatus Pedobacter colombiensis TaxID=3121371 RepID=A0AAJ5W8M2_9SPHI|nr:thioredoxin family protein [Pedobacter sp.]WEK19105.1 MAG: thioredoxin family protein [Pedobacter sp.]